jgi:hypothetical protein
MDYSNVGSELPMTLLVYVDGDGIGISVIN